MPQSRSDIFTVSKLNRFAKHILESEIGSIWISAEISNFVMASSGHWYFTLKDARSQIKTAMFKGSNRKVALPPKEGDKVLVRGEVSLYEARGDYQLIASHLEPDGEGDLKAQFERLKTRLAAEGLFAQENKRPIPERPTKIGVITSPTGAAVRDILAVLKRRNPGIEVIIYPCLVQGSGAAADLKQAVETANQHSLVDALIIGRGGGSMEDLWCFNDENLARSIASSQLPIVSAVGHEIDFTICDFVADLRATTPTAAAEILSYSNKETSQQLSNLQRRLLSALVNRLQQRKQALLRLDNTLQKLDPKLDIQQQWQKLDQLTFRLVELTRSGISHQSGLLNNLHSRLDKQSPQGLIARSEMLTATLHKRLTTALNTRLKDAGQKLGNLCQLLDTVSPLATLSRGYSITYHQGNILKSKQNLDKGDVITTRLSDGEVVSRIE